MRIFSAEEYIQSQEYSLIDTVEDNEDLLLQEDVRFAELQEENRK